MARSTVLALGLALMFLPAALVLGDEPSAKKNAEEKPGIVIQVTGLRNDNGRLACGLFVEENWLGAAAVSGEGGEIEDGVALCRFHDVEPGTYAISTYHDENDNGRLDSGIMRIPKEGTAASNNAYRRFGPPRYRDAKFDYDGGVLDLEAEARYLGGGKRPGRARERPESALGVRPGTKVSARELLPLHGPEE